MIINPATNDEASHASEDSFLWHRMLAYVNGMMKDIFPFGDVRLFGCEPMLGRQMVIDF